MVSPKLDLKSCIWHHFLAVNKETYWFKWEHSRQDWPLHAIYCNPLLGGVVAYAVQLRLPAELGKHCVVVLVHLNM